MDSMQPSLRQLPGLLVSVSQMVGSGARFYSYVSCAVPAVLQSNRVEHAVVPQLFAAVICLCWQLPQDSRGVRCSRLAL